MLGTYKQSRLFSLDYYLGRTTERIPDLEGLRRRVAASPGRIWIVRDRDLGRLASDPEITATPVVRGPDLSAARLAPRAAAPPGTGPGL